MLFVKYVIEMSINFDQFCFYRGFEVIYVVSEEFEQGRFVDQSEDGQGYFFYGGFFDFVRVEFFLVENVICNIYYRFLFSSWYFK